MKVGVFYFPTDYGIDIAELAKALEDRGFDSLFVPEHTHIPVSRKTPFPGGGELPKRYSHTHDPFVAHERARQIGVELLSLDELMATSDFVTLHLAKTPETIGLIGKDLLARSKPGIRIINVARGGIVDEEALAEAVRSGQVAGAALDVFASEPTTESPLFGLPEVVVTPSPEVVAELPPPSSSFEQAARKAATPLSAPSSRKRRRFMAERIAGSGSRLSMCAPPRP